MAASCSLLHVPMSLRDDAAVDEDVRPWLAGAIEKLEELRVLKRALWSDEAVVKALEESRAASASLCQFRSGCSRKKLCR